MTDEQQKPNIIQAPSEILTTPSTEVSKEEAPEVLRKLIEQYDLLPPTKLGLAAPQIGINKNMAIVRGVPMMNLSFTPAQQPDLEEEGCFSLTKGSGYWRAEADIELPDNGDCQDGTTPEEAVANLWLSLNK